MSQIRVDCVVDCINLTKDQINEEIVTETEGLTNVNLKIQKYRYEDFTGLILPANVIRFNCAVNQITSFAELTLPDSLKIFICSNNQITSFAGLTLPDSLIKFYCDRNEIKSFKLADNTEEFILPKSIVYFDCSINKIKSFTGLKLNLPLLRHFDCSDNQITSFTGLTLPNSVTYFNCSYNKITSFIGLTLPSSLTKFDCRNLDDKIIIEDFIFPNNLAELEVDRKVKFVNPKFNSALKDRLWNHVTYDNLNNYYLLFIYLNFRFAEVLGVNYIDKKPTYDGRQYQKYELLLTKLTKFKY
jgi:Leucine-rich repeat (LRR) protein